MTYSWYEKNAGELAAEDYRLQFAPFELYCIDINGVRFSSEGDGRYVSEDGDEFDYFREFDGEGYKLWLKDDISSDDVSYLHHLFAGKSAPSDFEVVLNGGLRPTDYRTVESLSFLYDGEL